jgi:hypothetical protein
MIGGRPILDEGAITSMSAGGKFGPPSPASAASPMEARLQAQAASANPAAFQGEVGVQAASKNTPPSDIALPKNAMQERKTLDTAEHIAEDVGRAAKKAPGIDVAGWRERLKAAGIKGDLDTCERTQVPMPLPRVASFAPPSARSDEETSWRC